ncbi:MFS transporter [Roseomonas elaeocarpi]|uniref:MFS transporter n=1 Tax=Roseomonas elaeocarpi TaxID=907779 RepID=A0ABV6JND7_9PROT
MSGTALPAAAPQPVTEAVSPPPAPPVPAPMPLWRMGLYVLASLITGLTQGLVNNLVAGNLLAVQATFGATTNESVWLTAAYSSTSITASLLLYKFRTQFGLRLFAELGLCLFVGVAAAHFLAHDLRSAVIVRAAAGFVAAPLGTLAFLYMLEIMPPQHKLTIGVTFGLCGSQLATPLARLVSPYLLDTGLWQNLNLLELGLALLSLSCAFLLPLTPMPRAKIFDRVDAISLPLLVVGMGLLSVVLSLGRYYWWFEAPWLGFCLAGGIACLALLVAVEANRANPLLHLRWLSSETMIVFGGAMLLSRFVLAEQTTGMIGFFQTLGLLNDHMTGMLWVVFAATAASFPVLAVVNRPQNTPAIHAVALLMIAIGAWMDGDATSLTRPHDVYVSQALVAFGGALFLPSALTWCFTHTIRSGMQYLTSFFAVFLASQNLGGLLGSSMLGTLLTVREKFHSSQIVEHLTLADPLVAQRVAQYGATYGRVLGDGALRSAEGAALLAQVATREAYVLAYNDLFRVVSGVSGGCLLLLFIHLLVRKLRDIAVQRRAQPV